MTPKHLHLALSLAATSCIATPALVAQAKPSAAIPATPVTSAPPPVTAPAVAAPAAHRATITWINGALTIDANNSSLNSILRDISLRTGMKITGGVQEERVFGHYGPATAAIVIAQLMNGARCNVMLLSDAANLPVQLTLTPLTGGASPPSPMQSAPEPEDAQQAAPLAVEQPQPTSNPGAPTPLGGLPSTAPSGTPSTDSTTTTEQSPNGVKTPEDVVRQLQELRRHNQTQNR